ncbi:MAG: RagB/SusD protein [Chitinophagaceae bacterium]|nr:RagB/SusD protein [Chitinophagaceae bacterium]
MKTYFKIRIINICSVCFFLLSQSACKKLVTIDPPLTQTTTPTVFANDNTAIAAQIAVYQQMNSDPANLKLYTALSADELNSTLTSTTQRNAYINNLIAATDGGGLLLWTAAYKYFYQENAIIENTQASTGISAKAKPIILGEAKFMRAWWYFYLVNLYGDVPLVTTSDYTVNSTFSRTPKDQVYAQIVKDLTEAKTQLSDQYVDASDIIVTADRIRPTTWAVDALLARVYLYLGNGHYADAETQASLVIANTAKFSLPADPNNVFKANSTEAIWQLLPTSTVGATQEGYFWVLTTKPSTSSYGTISNALFNAFETGDKRKVAWVGSITVSGTTYYFPNKYKYKTSPGSTLEYSMMLRLAEQYLIRAEARAQQNKLTGAISDLNVIRQRAGLSVLPGNLSQVQVLAAVAQERRVELFTEADRWLDLKRTGAIDAVMGSPGNATQAKGGANWQPYQAFYPIPILDISKDPNLTQTPGY